MKNCPNCESTNTVNRNTYDFCIDCGYTEFKFDEKTISPEFNSDGTGTMLPKKFIKYGPEIRDDGIYYPRVLECEEGYKPAYDMVISKEMFVEAFNKWVLPECADSIYDLVIGATKRKYINEWAKDETIYPKGTYLICAYGDDRFCCLKIADGINKFNDLLPVKTVKYM